MTFTDILPLLFPLFQFFKKNTWNIKYKRLFGLVSYFFLILWATFAIYYELLEKDFVNVILLTLMILFVSYLLYKNPRMLERRFIVNTISIAVLIYFPAKLFDSFIGTLTNATAYFAYLLSKNLVANINFEYTVINSWEYSYKFTFACTGLQSIALVISPILAADFRKYWKKALGVSVLIYLLNMVRSVGVIYGVEVLDIDYYLLHTLVMKFFSIVVIIIIFYYVLSTTKELAEELKGMINEAIKTLF
ncbi:MAG: hypothetical protein DRJ64_09605 [Thermoprotei archaeon]|nr:MAG: hypothetical protein DRJ64_09605 [Thermoprotei archaeon]